MQICVIGTGYVGLVSGTCFAEAGNDVICVDVDRGKIDRLNDGHVPIFEPGLEPMVQFNRAEGRLKFTTDLASAINESDISFIAVGTPPNEDGSADLRHVLEVAENIAQNFKTPPPKAERRALPPYGAGRVLVGIKSTVPVGTGDRIEALFREKLRYPFAVFSNPEFLKEGDAVNDFMKPDRVIIGTNDDSIVPLLRELYAPFTRKSERVLVMSRRSAELTKYAANAMLATRISFMNEMAGLCERLGANVNDIRAGIGSDPRIGSAFLYPGMGYGGSCFPKDVAALLSTGKGAGVKLSVVEAVEEANQRQKQALFQKIAGHFGGPEKLRGAKIAVWGLAFKAKTDDIRESPALSLIEQLLSCGCQLSVFDPQAMENASTHFKTPSAEGGKAGGAGGRAPDRAQVVYEHERETRRRQDPPCDREGFEREQIQFKKSSYDCLENAAALVLATEWNEFRSPDYGRIKKLMREPVIFDGRNILNKAHLKELGFVYYGIGV